MTPKTTATNRRTDPVAETMMISVKVSPRTKYGKRNYLKVYEKPCNICETRAQDFERIRDG